MELQVSSVDNTNLYFMMIRNGTLTGPATFTDPGETYSAVEIDTAATDRIFYERQYYIFRSPALSGSSSPIHVS